MRNLKKIIAVLVTLSMLLGAFALTAAAADVTVTLTGRTQMEAGDSYFADLKVSGATGGVQGTIAYDTDALEYVGVTYSDAFKAVNAGLDTTPAVSEENGTVKFVGLNPGADKVWFTLEFKVNVEGEVAVGDAFTVKASNTAGTATVTAEVTGASVVAVAPDKVDMEGATIKATAKAGEQDLKLIAKVNSLDKKVVEYGVVFLPTHLLKGAELNNDLNFVYGKTSSGKDIKAVVARVKGEDLEVNVDLYATLTGSASYNAGSLIQVDITSRAYAVLEDGTILYSNNDKVDTNIVDGYAVKSIIGVSKAIANSIKDKAVYSDETIANVGALQTILDTNEKLDTNTVAAVLAFLKANEGLI